ncbi:DUF6630 family protein [Microbacterium tumbae]
MATDGEGATEDWIVLCALLDEDAELAAAVRSAAEAEDGDDPWIVMLDGLDDAGALAYLDRTDSGIELSDALAQLPRIFATGVDLEPVGDVDGDLESAVDVAVRMLAPYGLGLVYLEEDSDAYPLVAVPRDRVERIVSLAAARGRTARAYA